MKWKKKFLQSDFYENHDKLPIHKAEAIGREDSAILNYSLLGPSPCSENAIFAK